MNKEKVALYHYYLGGYPIDYAERGLREHLDKLSDDVIQEFVDQEIQNQRDGFERAVDAYYIRLLDFSIEEVAGE